MISSSQVEKRIRKLTGQLDRKAKAHDKCDVYGCDECRTIGRIAEKLNYWNAARKD